MAGGTLLLHWSLVGFVLLSWFGWAVALWIESSLGRGYLWHCVCAVLAMVFVCDWVTLELWKTQILVIRIEFVRAISSQLSKESNGLPLWMALACSLPKAVGFLFFSENIVLFWKNHYRRPTLPSSLLAAGFWGCLTQIQGLSWRERHWHSCCGCCCCSVMPQQNLQTPLLLKPLSPEDTHSWGHS